MKNYVQVPTSVETLIEDDGSVVGYTKGGVLFSPQKDEKFFSTLPEAKLYQKSTKPTREDILKVIKYLADVMEYRCGRMEYSLYDSLCKNAPESVRAILARCFDEYESTDDVKNPFKSKEYYDNMKQALNGFVVVGGIQFRPQEVSRVEWSPKDAVITFSDGKKLKTQTQTEFQFVQLLLGPKIGSACYDYEDELI